jgi:2'-5' RNA ligase
MIRTFIAVKISDSVRKTLAGLIDDLKRSHADVKWVVPDNLHLTLKFLGDVDESRVGEVGDTVSQACSGVGPFDMSLAGLGAFPNVKRPRVIWVGIVKGKDILASLSETIEKQLESMGFPREERGFSAHLTIGRFRREGRPGDLADRLSVAFDCGECIVDRVYLMKSTLTPKGPIYEELQHFPLKQN